MSGPPCLLKLRTKITNIGENEAICLSIVRLVYFIQILKSNLAGAQLDSNSKAASSLSLRPRKSLHLKDECARKEQKHVRWGGVGGKKGKVNAKHPWE